MNHFLVNGLAMDSKKAMMLANIWFSKYWKWFKSLFPQYGGHLDHSQDWRRRGPTDKCKENNIYSNALVRSSSNEVQSIYCILFGIPGIGYMTLIRGPYRWFGQSKRLLAKINNRNTGPGVEIVKNFRTANKI